MTFQYCFDGSIKKVNNLSVSSPRTWGCFWTFCRIAGCCRVFPTHVGVFLHEFNTGRPGSGLPHARGGVSIKTDTSYLAQRSSPRTWGCFLEGWGAICACVVFPTHVGVFPRDPLSSFSGARLPHARGGAPSRGCPPKAPSSRLGLFTSTLDIDSFIWREWQKGRRTCLNIF